ncbi:Protein CUP-SHAPED COTYLEDON 3 [Hibiscus syriacus]|uniref:Protein CUP-SHAPED COTYLEDON 3 n=1 Tax=Hibiscus syriacus TaxID=106335 RepID=A0A6A2YYW1_HIBSY|nr:NAC domain-containing protein 21/22-like [Hibiscus syriacus]KAE8684593.1 Protein CUP-SHAPED COTYLEDON 3 [Hibiscus syriacus]
MGLRDIGATLPPGFRFYPSDEELVCHYLFKKIANEEALKGTLVEIDLHTCEPWQLPEVAKLNASEWYFFSFRDRKYATGFRTNRATVSGYWKATGKDRTVIDPTTQQVVGLRKTLVFYLNRAPNGVKTGWIMHEFRLETPHMPPKEDWVLCRVFHKTRGDDNNSPTMMLETSSSHGPTSTDQKSLHCGYQLQQIRSSLHSPHTNQSQSQTFLSLLQCNNSREKDDNDYRYGNEVRSKVDDEFEFLWDMDMEQNNLDDMGFEIDNNVVFL